MDGCEQVALFFSPHLTNMLRYLTDMLDSVSGLNIERYIAAMANPNELPGALTEVLEKIRRDAYAAGWRDALAVLSKAAGEMTGEAADNFDAGDMQTVQSTATRSGDPKIGSTPWVVLQAIRKKHGMTGSEIVSVVQEGGHKVSEASIRTSLVRLSAKRLIESRHKKWFPKGL